VKALPGSKVRNLSRKDSKVMKDFCNKWRSDQRRSSHMKFIVALM
jgi:hypothetical protein